MQEESKTADRMVVQDKRSTDYVRYPNLAIYYCLTMASGHYLPILYHSDDVVRVQCAFPNMESEAVLNEK